MRNKIKICVVIHGFHNGGIEKVMDNYFANMDRSNYELHVITYMKPDLSKQKIFLNMGFRVHQLSNFVKHAPGWKNIREHWNLFAKERFDVIHNNCPENLLPTVIGHILGTRIRIAHSHMNYRICFQDKSLGKRVLYFLGMKICKVNSTVLLACSKVAGASVFGWKAVNSGECKIIYNSVDMEKFVFCEKVRTQYRVKLGLKDEVLIGHVGRFEGIPKNHEFVIHVFQKFKRLNPNAKLILIGEGPRKQEFQNMVHDMGLDDSVIFTGAVLNVNDYYQGMDGFLFPSRFEGLGVALIEAQCCGLPCLISDRIPEEAIINPNVRTMSLEAGCEKWAEELKKMTDRGRLRDGPILHTDQYNILNNLKYVQAIYDSGQ